MVAGRHIESTEDHALLGRPSDHREALLLGALA